MKHKIYLASYLYFFLCITLTCSAIHAVHCHDTLDMFFSLLSRYLHSEPLVTQIHGHTERKLIGHYVRGLCTCSQHFR